MSIELLLPGSVFNRFTVLDDDTINFINASPLTDLVLQIWFYRRKEVN